MPVGIGNIPILDDHLTLQFTRSQELVPSNAVIAMFGLSSSRAQLPSAVFRAAGDIVLLLGETRTELESTTYAAYCHQVLAGIVPALDYDFEGRVCQLMLELVGEGLLYSARSLGAGGLAYALGVSGLMPSRPLGLSFEVEGPQERSDACLFSESSGRYLVTTKEESLARVEELAARHDIRITGRGVVGGKSLEISGAADAQVSLATAYKVWVGALADFAN